jgi:hypothetical protein
VAGQRGARIRLGPIECPADLGGGPPFARSFRRVERALDPPADGSVHRDQLQERPARMVEVPSPALSLLCSTRFESRTPVSARPRSNARGITTETWIPSMASTTKKGRDDQGALKPNQQTTGEVGLARATELP